MEVDLKNYFIRLPRITEKTWYQVADYLQIKVHSDFHRIEFTNPTEGFSYLKIDPPRWAIILNIILTLLICIGVTVFAIFNEFDNELIKE